MTYLISVTWFRGKTELKADDRYKFDKEQTKFNISSTQTADGGKYYAVAKDKSGESKWAFTLSVLSSKALGVDVQTLLKVILDSWSIGDVLNVFWLWLIDDFFSLIACITDIGGFIVSL